MSNVIAIFIANIIRNELKHLYDIQQSYKTETDYTKGQKDALLKLIRCVADYLDEEQVVKAEEFVRQALPV